MCVCTYKRIELLNILLEKLQWQITNNFFNYSIIVVDNDYKKSAKNTVQKFEKNGHVEICYLVEPEQNISLARNKAIKNAMGDFVAGIDDDEYPGKDWLVNFFNLFKSYKCDGVLGPVIPVFPEKHPKWIKKGNIFRSNCYENGTVLRWNETRTSNFFVRSEIFNSEENIFDSSFGRTGGEDLDFFKRMIVKGYKFVWCNEAPVFEIILPQRYKIKWILKRFLASGSLYEKNR